MAHLLPTLGKTWPALLVALVLALPLTRSSRACTTAVISGKATIDGRPLLWKNRDTKSGLHNEVAVLEGGRFKAIAVVNAGQRKAIWMGVNEAGFCIENSVSNDLALEEKGKGPGNGRFMKLALEKCATVADFEKLLEETNETGRSTTANFGVIDAQGGAVLFETGPKSYVKFDANDPAVAPHGYVVRSNFSTTARGFDANPAPEQLKGLYSGERYLRACTLLDARGDKPLTLNYVIRHCTRDLCDSRLAPLPGSVNGPTGTLPEVIATANTISRTTTVSAAVFHGVRPGEDPALTTMWTLLGDPKFSIAVPCWVAAGVADPLSDDQGGEIGEIAIRLREASLTPEADGVYSAALPGLWHDLFIAEDRFFTEIATAKDGWSKDGFTAQELAARHTQAASTAIEAMERELVELQDAESREAVKTPALVGSE